MKGPRIGERRADELHDFNFVAARHAPSADHVGHRERAGDGDQQDDDEADAADHADGAPLSRAIHVRS